VRYTREKTLVWGQHVSHYLNLSDDDKIKIASDAVRCNVPIAPVIAGWLHENGLHERVINPRKTNAETAPVENEQGTVR
jgi:hypothetical protein